MRVAEAAEDDGRGALSIPRFREHGNDVEYAEWKPASRWVVVIKSAGDAEDAVVGPFPSLRSAEEWTTTKSPWVEEMCRGFEFEGRWMGDGYWRVDAVCDPGTEWDEFMVSTYGSIHA